MDIFSSMFLRQMFSPLKSTKTPLNPWKTWALFCWPKPKNKLYSMYPFFLKCHGVCFGTFYANQLPYMNCISTCSDSTPILHVYIYIYIYACSLLICEILCSKIVIPRSMLEKPLPEPWRPCPAPAGRWTYGNSPSKLVCFNETLLFIYI